MICIYTQIAEKTKICPEISADDAPAGILGHIERIIKGRWIRK